MVAAGGSDERGSVAEFPPGLPESDRLQWSLLPIERKMAARDRLAAVLRVTSGETTVAVAAEAGLVRRSLADLVAKWRKSPGLKALGIHVGDQLTRSSKVDKERGGWVEDAARKLLEAQPDASNEAIVGQLTANPGGAVPAINTLRSRVDRARRELKASTGEFGRAIACDVSAIEIAHQEGDPYWLAAVVDQATGLVLGWATGRQEDGVGVSRRACHDALMRLPNVKVAGPIAASTDDMEIQVSTGSAQDLWDLQALTKRVGVDAYRVDDGKRLGSHILRAMGQKLNRYPFRPRWTRKPQDAQGKKLTFASQEDMASLASDAIEAHNAAIIAQRTGNAASTKLDDRKAEISAMLNRAWPLK